MEDRKNKKKWIVTPLKLPDLTSLLDSAKIGNKVWLMNFLLACSLFRNLKSKSTVLVPKSSNLLVGRIQIIFDISGLTYIIEV